MVVRLLLKGQILSYIVFAYSFAKPTKYQNKFIHIYVFGKAHLKYVVSLIDHFIVSIDQAFVCGQSKHPKSSDFNIKCA